jgi:hypothetical protein
MAQATIDSQAKKGLEICTLDEIMFPVEKVDETGFDCNSDYAYNIFGYLGKDEVKTRLNVCSDRYELVPNSSIFMPVRETLKEKGITFTETYMHMNNARFYGNFMIEGADHLVNGNPNDKVKPMLKVQHSYNGLTKYMISFGYYRMVCTNGLTIPVKEKQEFNVSITGKHTQSILLSIKKLFSTIDLFVNEGQKFLVNFDTLAKANVLNVEERIIEVMNASGLSLLDNKNVNTLDFIGGVINDEAFKYYNGNANDFLVYNGINQYINNNSLNVKAPEVRAEMDKAVLQYMLG